MSATEYPENDPGTVTTAWAEFPTKESPANTRRNEVIPAIKVRVELREILNLLNVLVLFLTMPLNAKYLTNVS